MTYKPINKTHKLFALNYINEGYNIKKDQLMGRQAAGWAFLKSIIQSKRYKHLGVYLKTQTEKDLLLEDIKNILSDDNRTLDIETVGFNRPDLTEKFGGIQLPGPDISKYAEQRSFFGHNKYSICGITHTTASDRILKGFSKLLTEPVMPWDAVICTSDSVYNTISKVVEVRKEYLERRFNSKLSPILPQLPIIPLGVNCDEFNFTDADKKTTRDSLSISEDDIVVVYVGRLSFHAKAHHLPMYIALENAAKKLSNSKKIHLIQTGWFASDFIEEAMKEEARSICPSVNCLFLDGREQGLKLKTFASADIFMSLSDNIQETFGLTPLEAMASGVPVIVSDWNGYRSTVRNNKDGYRITSYALGEGHGEDLIYDYMIGSLTYDLYIGNSVSKVAIDIQECINKLNHLIENKDKRKELGNNGQKRARNDFSWVKILDKYEELYDELDNIRVKESSQYKTIINKHYVSDRLDPFYLFDDYPTNILNSKTPLYRNDSLVNIEFDEFLKLKSINYYRDLPKQEDLEEIMKTFNSKNPNNILEITNKVNIDQIDVERMVVFLMKYGFINTIEASNE